MKFVLSPPLSRKLLVEAFVYLALARVLKAMPFSKVAPTLGKAMLETTSTLDVKNQSVLKDISRAIRIISRHTIWESKCLVRAIAAMKMLERRGLESTLYLGTAKDSSGSMVAHAWLRSGPIYITGFEEMYRFKTVAIFGKQLVGNGGRGDEQRTGFY
ncbi:lasso peptide biosynthesis B2 protein [Paenibacillus sp. TRM 82003]|nr:lasso peptide biosynthesis B2 protein [Paenibacillus sp. TRM 82003]